MPNQPQWDTMLRHLYREQPALTFEQAVPIFLAWKRLGFSTVDSIALLNARIEPNQSIEVGAEGVETIVNLNGARYRGRARLESGLTEELIRSTYTMLSAPRGYVSDETRERVARAAEALYHEEFMPIQRMTREQVAALAEESETPSDPPLIENRLLREMAQDFEQATASTEASEADVEYTSAQTGQRRRRRPTPEEIAARLQTEVEAPEPERIRRPRRRRQPAPEPLIRHATAAEEEAEAATRPPRRRRRRQPVVAGSYREAATRPPPSRLAPVIRQTQLEHRPSRPHYSQETANYIHYWLNKHEESSRDRRAELDWVARSAADTTLLRAQQIAQARITETLLPIPKQRWQRTFEWIRAIRAAREAGIHSRPRGRPRATQR